MNKNLLKGISCPECGSEGPFMIEQPVFWKVFDDHAECQAPEDGWFELGGDLNVGCQCCQCKYYNELSEFDNSQKIE